jgi:vacuolar iron transporter family protein
MKITSELKRYLDNYSSEKDAITLYGNLAEAEKNPNLKEVYQKLSETEKKHASFWADKIKAAGYEIPESRPSLKTRLFGWIAAKMGPSFILPAVARIEKKAASGYNGQADAEAAGMPGDEKSHARVFGILSRTTAGIQGADLARFEGRHKAVGGNALRAAVLGANDGLVSVFCLVMGVAGAGVRSRNILVTGLAGLLAGALSMALGEWLSVQSSRELYQHQIDVEKGELSEVPEEEKEELALIYQAKGMDAVSAEKLAGKMISDPATALDTLAREELGIDPEELGGSAWEASITSFLMFSLGAIIPVISYVLFSGIQGIIMSAVFSTIGLFIIGSFITMMTGKNPVLSGLRQVLFGLATAAVTFGIGRLIGVSLLN